MSSFAPAVEHAVKLIELLSNETDAVGVSEISRKLKLNKNMVFRILNSLEQEGWVYCDKSADRKYRLSLALFRISSQVINKLSLNTVATPHIYDLWKQTGESTYLGIRKDDMVMYIQHLDCIKNVRVAGVIGGTYDLYCTAPGKVILAFSEEEFINKYLSSSFKKHTKNTLTENSELRHEIEKIRSDEYAIDDEEFSKGIICLAAPIFDYADKLVGTAGCSLSTITCDSAGMVEKYGNLIINTAKEISKCLGCNMNPRKQGGPPWMEEEDI